MSEDKRIVAGACCTWWGPISEVSTRNGLPVCPHCLNVLYEFESREAWDKSVEAHEKRGHPSYKKMVDFGRGLCFPSYQALEQAYKS